MNQNLIEIICVLDRSGSMASIKDDMEGGFDKYMDDMRKMEQACQLTLVQFDSNGIDTIYESTPVQRVKKLQLVPRGMTPLLDAVGKTIDETGIRFKNMPEDNRPGKVMFLILTDGQENASCVYKRDEIKEMIQHQTNVYKWEFVYLGAGPDTFAEAASMGIAHQGTYYYSASPVATANVFKNISAGTRSYAGGQSVSPTADWGDKEREEMQQK